MKTSALTICLVAVLVAVAAGQAPTPPPQSNDKYVVDKQWAQVPADLPWNSSTSNIAPDGKGNVVVLRASHDLKQHVDVWGPAASAADAARALKGMFDPSGILNAGRGPI